MKLAAGFLAVLIGSVTIASEPGPRSLTFQERLQAQEAIERVYYAHRIGETVTFEQAMPRAVLESRVRTYLEQTAALSVYWKVTVTDAMLEGELTRMAAGTKMPERLTELFAALGNDRFLIRECLGRPALVNRLARDAYALDPALHKDARRRAEALLDKLETGKLSPLADVPERSVITFAADASHRKQLRRRQVNLSMTGLRERRSEFGGELLKVSRLEETRAGFQISVVLSESPREFRVARYVVPKISWDEWWQRAKTVKEEAPVSSENPAAVTPASTSYGTICPAEGVWAPTSLSSAPSPREFQTAVWTGSEMIVWGGYFFDGGDILFDDGGRYDPATDIWTPISTSDAPSARGLHTAVWTGSRMVVWGGADFGGYINTGGRYDPTTDSWTPTSTTGAPVGRQNHTVVWTGSRMIVWGGYFFDGADHELNSGGRYDPVADTWASTSTGTGVPSGRDLHAAAWTGSRMVVWGGWDGGDVVNTGGRYDPTANTWTTTSTTNAPPGVELHTAVWAGNRVVVWGGWDGFEDVAIGGRYDPIANTWTAASTTGAPSIRDSHTAISTGVLMVVWGGGVFDGVSTFSALDTGGWYDPAANVWTSTATTSVPAARFYHTAIWTGTTMIVWGGEDAVDFFDTGGAYAFGSSADNDADGYTGCQGDCDDTNPAIHPGAPEICNGIDNDCDTAIDDGATVCDDANPCTTDTCGGVAGCSHVVDASPCADSDACTVDSCDPAVGCVYSSANIDETGFSTGRVDGRDLLILANAWNSCPADPAPSRYDPAADLDPTNPCIADTDFHLFMTTFGQVCP